MLDETKDSMPPTQPVDRLTDDALLFLSLQALTEVAARGVRKLDRHAAAHMSQCLAQGARLRIGADLATGQLAICVFSKGETALVGSFGPEAPQRPH